MNTLNPTDAYRLWAPSYAAETGVSALDEALSRQLSPSPKHRRLLDAGCGIGRRLAGTGAAVAIGVDASPNMLAVGGLTCTAAADVRALPIGPGGFDLVWCRLVLGHLADPRPAYREFARICESGGALYVSDFHADAVAAGQTRSFRDGSGCLRIVEHHVHDVKAHIAMAAQAGFVFFLQRDGLVGPAIEHFYIAANRQERYRRDIGLPVVAAFLFRRK